MTDNLVSLKCNTASLNREENRVKGRNLQRKVGNTVTKAIPNQAKK